MAGYAESEIWLTEAVLLIDYRMPEVQGGTTETSGKKWVPEV
jgi:hypothetical protein